MVTQSRTFLALRTCSLLLDSIPEPEHDTNMKSVSWPVCKKRKKRAILISTWDRKVIFTGTMWGRLTGKALMYSSFSSKFRGSLAFWDPSPGLCRKCQLLSHHFYVTAKAALAVLWWWWKLIQHSALTCLFGSNLMVSVCTRKGSSGGSCGFTGRKDENGTLTCRKQTQKY